MAEVRPPSNPGNIAQPAAVRASAISAANRAGRIALVDYDAGNLTSVRFALESLGIQPEITADPSVLAAADRVIFPGVGAARASMDALRRKGLLEALGEFARSGKPFLGICVGCQIILESSAEDGGTPCLGFLPGGTEAFRPSPGMKVPHMGWNEVRIQGGHPVLEGLEAGAHFYFVHSYYPQPGTGCETYGTTDYAGVTFASIIGRGNLIACQFHAEKSGPAGLRLLSNFCAWDGSAAC